MIAAAALALLGAITFVPQEIPGIGSTANDPISGTVEAGFRLADIDGDGTLDLIQGRQIFLQSEGRFHVETPVSTPGHRADAACDLWGSDLYFFGAGHVSMSRLKVGRWERVLDQDIDAPLKNPAVEPAAPGSETEPPAGSPLRLSRFLHDLDGDGVPEIVYPAEDGIHIVARIDGKYRSVSTLKVFPSLQYGAIAQQRLWPADTRRIAFPPRQMACRYVVQGCGVTVISREDAPSKRVRYRLSRYTLDPRHDYSVIADKTVQSVTEPMAASMQARIMRPSGEIDFGGGDWEYSQNSALPQPVFVTQVSTDNGAHVQSVRAPFFRSRYSFLDMNNDGRADIIAEASDVFTGGVRECIERFTNSTSVHHELRVYLQDEQGRFAATPSWTAPFQIGLLQPPLQNDDRFRWYQSGELLDASGDFNRDGYRDVAVHDQPGRIAIYLNAGAAGGFSSKPDAVIPVTPDKRFDVADVDGDGRSDVIVRWRDETQDGFVERNCVYFTRESAQ